MPGHGDSGLYSLERRSELLFSREHLAVIFEDPALLQRFTNFLCSHRSASLPLLIYYLDALKALRAIRYSNAVIDALGPLDGHDFSADLAAQTLNKSLHAKADAAFEALVRDDLPAYVTHVWIQTVTESIKRRIAGTLPAHLADMSEGLAEVFCLTDPSRHDNPIVFASEGQSGPIILAHGMPTYQCALVAADFGGRLHRILQDNAIRHELRARPQLSLPPGA